MEANCTCTSSGFPPSDRAPLTSLYSSNQNKPETSCRVTSDRAVKKGAATLSPRTLSASHNDQDYQWKLKKAHLDSTQTCLTSKLVESCFVARGSIRNQRIQEFAKSKSAEVLQMLHFSFSLSNGKSFSIYCKKAITASSLDERKKTKGIWACPACDKAIKNLNRKLKELDSLTTPTPVNTLSHPLKSRAIS